MEKYGKFSNGRDGDPDDEPMDQVDEDDIVELYRQHMVNAGGPGGQITDTVELKDEEADKLLDLLGLKIEGGHLVPKEG